MKKSIIGIIIVAIAAGIGWYVYRRNSSKSARREIVESVENVGVVKPVESPDKPAQVSGSVEPETQPRPQSKFYVKPEEEPPGYEGFGELSQMQRLDLVTKEMHSKWQMHQETYDFLKAEMFNRDHWDVTRNNMANALIWTRNDQNQHPDPDLHEAFITMLEDETEDPVWRDYCLQFLSENFANSSDPKRVMGVITKYSKGDDSIAGTAMIHMALQERDGQVELDEDFGNQLAEKLEKTEVHRDTKLAIIGVMGTRKDIKQLPVIRKYAKQDEDAGLKRVAIAALGTIGASEETKSSITDDDKALVTSALTHKNRAVQMAARGALKRLSTDSTDSRR